MEPKQAGPRRKSDAHQQVGGDEKQRREKQEEAVSVESPIPMTLAASALGSRSRLVGFYDTLAAWNRRRFVV